MKILHYIPKNVTKLCITGMLILTYLLPQYIAAQADGWILNSSPQLAGWANLTPTSNAPVAAGIILPTPGGQFGYTGTPAQQSQHIRTNGDGQLIFFAIDGNLYDGDGYLIADNKLTLDCEECLEPGLLEFLSVPVPGSCGLYYLFACRPASIVPDANAMVIYSILDMNEDNPRFTGNTCDPRKGRLLELDGVEIGLHPTFPNWDQNAAQVIGEQDSKIGNLKDSTPSKTTSPMIRVVDGTATGSKSWLYYIQSQRIFVFELAPNGIFKVLPIAGSSVEHVVIAPNPPASLKPYYRDADVHIVNNVIQVAVVDDNLTCVGCGPSNILTMKFNNLNGTLINGSMAGYFIDLAPGSCVLFPTGVAGCAFSSDGSALYLTGETNLDCQIPAPFIRRLDLATEIFTDLTALAPDAGLYRRSRIYRNKAPNGVGDAIYLPRSTGGIDAITVVGETFLPDVLSGMQAPGFVEIVNTSNTSFPSFLAIGVVGDTHLSEQSRTACCNYFETVPGAVVGGYIHETGNVTWNGANNPLQPGSNVLVFTCDLVVKPGAQLTISNLTLRFANNAKIIVERSGRLNMMNTTATSLRCPGERWPGIRVEGNSADPSQDETYQGRLNLFVSTIENAHIGAWASREGAGGGAVYGYYGGIISAQFSTFRNCITGADIRVYLRANNAPNKSNFLGCKFETTTDWPDPGVSVPRKHAHLFRVDGVVFMNCKFTNDAFAMFPALQRGWGVHSHQSGFTVLGTGPNASLFRNLSIGVNAATGAIRRAKIENSYFRDNYIGTQLVKSTASRISHSHFFVPPYENGFDFNLPRGLVLNQSTGYLVEENTFNGEGPNSVSIGIHFLGNVPAENEIYNNTFNSLAAGAYVQGRHKGGSVTGGIAGLQILCGDYFDCMFDYYLEEFTWIREQQGSFYSWNLSGSQMSGNRFFNGITNGITIVDLQETGADMPFFRYIRHDVQECDPLNPSPYYMDDPKEEFPVFDKAAHCGNSRLPMIGGGGGLNAYQLAAAQLQSASSYFNGTVDTGERENIMDAIKQNDPWLPSHTLRDYMLARSPLSDEVLVSAIHREVPMDAWHLTQVMLENARLTPRVERDLEMSGLLNEYMLSLVLNAGSGPTSKDLLVQEVELRSIEKAHAQVIAFDEIANDSLLTDMQATLYGLVAAHPEPSDYYLLSEIALEQGDHVLAHAWLDSLAAVGDTDHELMRTLTVMHEELNGEWEAADASQRAQLYTMIESAQPGAAMAWGILYELGETVEVPLIKEPTGTKSLLLPHRRINRSSERPVLEAHPNPSVGTSMLVIGLELDEPATVRITDPLSRLVRTYQLGKGQRMLEVELMGLANGLYACELLMNDLRLATTKLMLQR